MGKDEENEEKAKQEKQRVRFHDLIQKSIP